MTEHYFSDRPESSTDRRQIPFEIRDLKVSLTTDRGVFSATRVDKGSLVLCNATIPPPTEGDLLDLGCGYGPIAVMLASRHPDRQVWATDVNQRALELTKTNAQALKLENLLVATPDEIPQKTRFAAIYSNPPIKVGKQVLHSMLNQWLPRLENDGAAFMVVHKHLGSDSLARWLEEQRYETKRVLSSSGYRVLRAKPCREAS